MGEHPHDLMDGDARARDARLAVANPRVDRDAFVHVGKVAGREGPSKAGYFFPSCFAAPAGAFGVTGLSFAKIAVPLASHTRS